MLTPKELAALPAPVLELWAEAEQAILADMARRISTYDYWIPAADHQNLKLLESGRLQDEILRVLSVTTKRSEEELRQMMVDAGSRCLKSDIEIYREAGIETPVPAESETLTAILNAGYAQTAQTMKNLTRTTANTTTKQFEDALDRAWLKATSGGFDYGAAIRTAIKDLSAAGVGAIEYPSGHIDSVDVAVRRAVLTGINQTACKLQEQLADEVGCDLVEVTAHSGARPSHAVWQGKIYSRSGQSDKYPDFRAATGYGTGPGLGGWNCRHSFGPYIEGSQRVWSDQALAELEEPKYEYNGVKMTEYEATQYQRKCERNIRRWKREYMAMEAGGQDTAEAAAKLKKWRKEEKAFCEQTGLKQSRDRTFVPKTSKTSAAIESAARKKEPLIKMPSDLIQLPSIPEMGKELANNNSITDVIEEYRQSATPGDGIMSVPSKRKRKNNEYQNMKLLHAVFGGDIEMLEESNVPGEKNPDYLWRGKLWEEKEPKAHTQNAVDKNLREALRQIMKNPGGVVLDIGDSEMQIDELERTVYARLKRSANFHCDVIIVRNGKIKKIWRYKNR